MELLSTLYLRLLPYSAWGRDAFQAFKIVIMSALPVIPQHVTTVASQFSFQFSVVSICFFIAL